MRPLDPRYQALQAQVDQYGREYLEALARQKRRKRAGAVGMFLALLAIVAALVTFAIGVLAGGDKTFVTFITL